MADRHDHDRTRPAFRHDQTGTPQLIGLSLPPGHEAAITFIEGRLLPGAPEYSATWQFALYQWRPPVTAAPAPAEPRLPSSYTGYNTSSGHGQVLRRLIATRSGDWPADRTATFTVTFRRNLDISVVCAGAIAGRLEIIAQVGGHGDTPVPRASWKPGEDLPQNGGGLSGRVGIPLTLTFRFQAPDPYAAADYAKRAASWTIAIYEEQY